MKNFMGNLATALPPSPASAFIGGAAKKKPEGKKVANGSAVLPSSGKSKGNDAESKTARVQLLMRPSLVARLKAVARSRRQSLNALINETMERVK